MIMFVEYTFNGKTGKICYDISHFSIAEAKMLLPEWLKGDDIQYESYQIKEILKSIMS